VLPAASSAAGSSASRHQTNGKTGNQHTASNKQTASKQQIYNKQSTETNILNGQRRSRLARFLPAFLQRVFFIAKRPFFTAGFCLKTLFFPSGFIKSPDFSMDVLSFFPYYGIFWGIVPIINGTMNFRY